MSSRIQAGSRMGPRGLYSVAYGLMSRTGVPSMASRPRTVSRSPSTASSATGNADVVRPHRPVPGQNTDLRPRGVAARVRRTPACVGGLMEMEDHLDVGEAVQPEGSVGVQHGRVQDDP